MSVKIRKEEYTSLGDFIATSFVRDQAAIMQRFPKLNADFLAAFTSKLNEVKTLESGLVLTEEQKTITASLYNEAGILNKELNFLKSYLSHAGLDTTAVMDLKNDLISGNMEGAVLKIESLKQFVTAKANILEAEGMDAHFVNTLEAHKTSLANKNSIQNNYMNSRKTLTEANKNVYNELYSLIMKIADAGKLVFDGTITKEEYTVTKTVNRMRVAKLNENNKAA